MSYRLSVPFPPNFDNCHTILRKRFSLREDNFCHSFGTVNCLLLKLTSFAIVTVLLLTFFYLQNRGTREELLSRCMQAVLRKKKKHSNAEHFVIRIDTKVNDLKYPVEITILKCSRLYAIFRFCSSAPYTVAFIVIRSLRLSFVRGVFIELGNSMSLRALSFPRRNSGLFFYLQTN